MPEPLIIGNDGTFLQRKDEARKLAKSDSSICILGESGSGKDVFAKLIHAESGRSNRPLKVINSGAVPDNLAEDELFGHEKGAFTGAISRRIGVFEKANGGTVFFDEIGDIPKGLQVKLLRVLESKTIMRLGGEDEIKVDFRIICATNRDLKKAVEDGEFREDLYHRLVNVAITIPPLRERGEDIKLLITHFAGDASDKIDDDVVKALSAHDWPNNVRELKYFIERVITFYGPDGLILENIVRELEKHKEQLPRMKAKQESGSTPGNNLDKYQPYLYRLGLQESKLTRTACAIAEHLTEIELNERRNFIGEPCRMSVDSELAKTVSYAIALACLEISECENADPLAVAVDHFGFHRIKQKSYKDLSSIQRAVHQLLRRIDRPL